MEKGACVCAALIKMSIKGKISDALLHQPYMTSVKQRSPLSVSQAVGHVVLDPATLTHVASRSSEPVRTTSESNVHCFNTDPDFHQVKIGRANQSRYGQV